MPHMIRFKLPKTTPEYGYIYINAKAIHAITPCDDWARVFYGHGNDVYVEHKPSDIVYALANDFTSVRD